MYRHQFYLIVFVKKASLIGRSCSNFSFYTSILIKNYGYQITSKFFHRHRPWYLVETARWTTTSHSRLYDQFNHMSRNIDTSIIHYSCSKCSARFKMLRNPWIRGLIDFQRPLFVNRTTMRMNPDGTRIIEFRSLDSPNVTWNADLSSLCAYTSFSLSYRRSLGPT
jgi:hypothetical protein